MKQGCQGAWPRVEVAFGFSIKASARRRALWERPAPRQGYPVWHPPPGPSCCPAAVGPSVHGGSTHGVSASMGLA